VSTLSVILERQFFQLEYGSISALNRKRLRYTPPMPLTKDDAHNSLGCCG
jgi:hypothetical protein